jgi:hypothetical protein
MFESNTGTASQRIHHIGPYGSIFVQYGQYLKSQQKYLNEHKKNARNEKVVGSNPNQVIVFS